MNPQAPRTRRRFLRDLAAAGAATSVAAWSLAPLARAAETAGSSDHTGHARRRPNIVFFLVDDMGWMDSEPYGSAYYDTPNITRLAREGMRFTNAYAANPLCSPTRASIMSGKYPARLRFTSPAGHLPPIAEDAPPLAETAPPHQRLILPESQRHLPPGEHTIAEALREAGYRTGFIGKWHMGVEPRHWPEEQGFEFSFHCAPDAGPPGYFSPYHPARRGTITDGPEGEYIADRVTDEALGFIERHAAEPFFLCLWHYNVHGPWGHKEELTAQYADRTDPRGKQNNPIMASMLKSVDESLGRVLDDLQRRNLAEDTVFILFSDNGGNIHSRIGPDKLPPTSNAPLRKGKGSLYEGGIRVPLIVRWPGRVERGAVSNELVHSIDFYPTILDMVGLPRPAGQLLDGLSIVPALAGGAVAREALFCHFPHAPGALGHVPATAVRRGDWKLIRRWHDGEGFVHTYELYNLREDPGEITNLADVHPELVRELDELIERHVRATDAAVPKPNPAYDPDAKRREKPAAKGQPAGWVCRGCGHARGEGALKLTPQGRKGWFMANASLKHAGPAVVELRVRVPSGGGGTVAVQWREADQPQFPGEQIVRGGVAPGDWQDVRIELPVAGTLAHLRVIPPERAAYAEFAHVRVRNAAGQVTHEWDF